MVRPSTHALRRRARGGAVLLGLLAVGAGCAPRRAPPAAPPAAPAPPPAPRLTAAILPADGGDFPRVAKALNKLLASAPIPGADEVVRAKVPVELVQISIECVEAQASCYAAVGKSMSANRLLFARLVPAGAEEPAGKSKHKSKRRRSHGPLQVEITLFDVDAGTAVHTASRSFKDQKAAVAGLEALLAEALTPVASVAAVAPAPPAQGPSPR